MLTIYLWQFLPNNIRRRYQNPHVVNNQGWFPPVELFLCHHIQFVTSEWQNPELGGFSISYVLVTSEPTDSQVSPFSPVGTISLSSCPVCHHVQFVTSEWQNFELGGFSIGYVLVTSEPTDSQVSPFSPVGTISLSSCPVRHLWMTKISSLVASQSVMSLLPLNRQIAKSHLSVQ